METDPLQFWTDEMIALFRKYCFPELSFDIFQKWGHLRVQNQKDHLQNLKKYADATYACHIFGPVLFEKIPFYLVLSSETNFYKESDIGYVQIVNGQNQSDEPQAKIYAHIRKELDIESWLDKVISDVNCPPGFGKTMTLYLYRSDSDRLKGTASVGIKLPIDELEIEYGQGQPKEKCPTQ